MTKNDLAGRDPLLGRITIFSGASAAASATAESY